MNARENEIDPRRLRRNGKAIRKALEDLLAMAREIGIKDPFVYIESEGGVHVMDNSLMPGGANPRCAQPACVFSVYQALPAKTDVGAW